MRAANALTTTTYPKAMAKGKKRHPQKIQNSDKRSSKSMRKNLHLLIFEKKFETKCVVLITRYSITSTVTLTGCGFIALNWSLCASPFFRRRMKTARLSGVCLAPPTNWVPLMRCCRWPVLPIQWLMLLADKMTSSEFVLNL